MIKKILLSAFLITSHGLSALEINQPLPMSSVNDKGELLINRDHVIHYRPWDVSALNDDKANLILHMAGRSSANKLIQPFTDRLTAENIASDKLHSTTIINLDDTLWGTRRLVASKIKDNKIKHPKTTFVLDNNGKIRTQWGLKKESAAIIILSASGEVVYLKQGRLLDEDIDQALAVINQQL